MAGGGNDTLDYDELLGYERGCGHARANAELPGDGRDERPDEGGA
jgi:hypothetical protein